MRVLVIGGTGAIGAPTVKALGRARHDVRSTARSEESKTWLKSLGVEPVDIDIYDTDALRRAMRGQDAVVRLTTKLPKSLMAMRSKSAFIETSRLRTVGAQRIVDAAIAENVQIYVTESFYAAYRSSGDSWVDENTPSDDGDLEPMKAVLTSDRYAQRFADANGRGIALRFGGFYGPQVGATAEMLDMLRKRMLPLIGTGDHFVPTVHVDDAASAVVAALSAPSGVYNVCDDAPQRWADFLATVAKMAGAPPPMRLPGFLGPLAMGYPWKWMSRSVRMSNARLMATGWAPAYADLAAGLATVIGRRAA